MKLQQFNPILYLEDYEDIPEDLCYNERITLEVNSLSEPPR